jgi:hypothetical protein
MKNNIFIFSFILFFSIFTIFVSCGKQKSEWGGTIEEVNGVTVVNNPGEPLYGGLVFDLEEDLSIGNEEDDDYLFYRILDIQVDKEENIYILESGNVRVQKFDKNGNYICTIGGKGQGPGEYQRLSQLIINEKEGTVGVKEWRKLIVFDKNGKFLDKDIAFEEFFFDLVLDSEGLLWGLKFDQEGEDEVTADMFKALVVLDNQGHLDKKVDRFPFDMYRERMESGAILSSVSGFEYDLFFSCVDEQNMVYGYSKEYELNIINLEGNLQLKIRKEEPYRRFTAEERRKSKRVQLTEYKPYFFDIFSDSEGRIFIQRNNARKIETVEKEFDVFSKDGYYLYKTVCQYTPYVIKDGYYYTRIQNEETGEVFVKRYKIKNWEQIREQ